MHRPQDRTLDVSGLGTALLENSGPVVPDVIRTLNLVLVVTSVRGATTRQETVVSLRCTVSQARMPARHDIEWIVASLLLHPAADSV